MAAWVGGLTDKLSIDASPPIPCPPTLPCRPCLHASFLLCLQINGMLLVHLPNGPTARFRLSSLKLGKDIKVGGHA